MKLLEEIGKVYKFNSDVRFLRITCSEVMAEFGGHIYKLKNLSQVAM